MMDGTILPELAALAGPATIVSRTLRSASLGESRVAEQLRDLFQASSNPSVAYLASSSEVKVRLTAKAPTERGGPGVARAAGLGGTHAAGRRRVHRGRRGAGGGGRTAAPGGRKDGRLRGVAHRRGSGGPADVRSRRVRLPHRFGGRLHRRREARGPGRLAGDDRRSGRGQPGVRPRDGRGGSPRVRCRSRDVVDGCRGPGTARRRRTGNGVDRPRRRRGAPCAQGSTCRASASASAGGPSRRRSIWHGDTWRASRSPAATSERQTVVDDRAARTDEPAMRLFIAVDVPRAVVLAVAAAIEPWREAFPNVRWVPPANWHVTLKFLGATPADTGVLGGGVGRRHRVGPPPRHGGGTRSRSVPVGGAGPGAVGRGGRPRGRSRRAGDGSRDGAGSGVPQGDAAIPPASDRRAVGASPSAFRPPTQTRRSRPNRSRSGTWSSTGVDPRVVPPRTSRFDRSRSVGEG